MTPKPTPSPAERRAIEAAQFLIDAYATRRPPGDAEPYALIVARALLSDHARLVEEIGRLREALNRIIDHECCAYDHPKASAEMYRGPYGIGIVDGHRAAAVIARAALSPSQKEGGGK